MGFVLERVVSLDNFVRSRSQRDLAESAVRISDLCFDSMMFSICGR